MSCNKTYKNTRSIQSFSTNSTYTPMTPWMPIAGMSDVNLILEQRGEVGNFQGRPAYLRNDNYIGGNGIDRYDVDLSPVGTPDLAATKFWVRFGVEAKLSASGYGSADVTLTVIPHACGKVVGRRRLVLRALTEEEQFAPVTGWISTAGLTAAKAALICSGNSAVQNSLKYSPAYRTASEDPTEPGSWSDLGTNEQTASNNDLVDIANESLSVSTDTWIQFGIRYNIPTSGSPGQTTIDAAFAVKS